MTQRIDVGGKPAWLKQYGPGRRRMRLALLDAVARGLGLMPLRPPPHHGGPRARAVEARRLAQLRGIGVRVPEVLEEREDALLISDIGPTLSSHLRACEGDPERLDAAAAAAIAAIAAAHARNGYFGQPWPRNLTWQEGEVGFLDFEEDPLEVMTLEQAQARDWLLFAYGAARFYRERPEALARMLRPALRDAPQAAAAARRVAARLRPLEWTLARLGRSARTLAQSIAAIRLATPP